MAGYQITKANVKVDNNHIDLTVSDSEMKKKNLITLEGICPICAHYPSQYAQVIKMVNNKRKMRNHYYCPECQSTWRGNYY